MKIKVLLGAAILALVIVSPRIGGAQGVTLNFKTVTVPNSSETIVAAINNANTLVGQYIDSTGTTHGMEIKGKTVTNIDDPNGTATLCDYENIHGVIVGDYVSNATGLSTGYVYQNGNFQDVLPFNSTYSVVGTINDGGVMVGYYQDPTTGDFDGFYGKLGNYTSFTVPTAVATFAGGINNAGTILATWQNSSGTYETSVYVPSTKTFTLVNVPGAADTFGDFVNNNNEIVYAWEDNSGNFHGAVRSASGQFLKFDNPNGTQTEGNGINDSAIVVGDFIPNTGNGQDQGFVATH